MAPALMGRTKEYSLQPREKKENIAVTKFNVEAFQMLIEESFVRVDWDAYIWDCILQDEEWIKQDIFAEHPICSPDNDDPN